MNFLGMSTHSSVDAFWDSLRSDTLAILWDRAQSYRSRENQRTKLLDDLCRQLSRRESELSVLKALNSDLSVGFDSALLSIDTRVSSSHMELKCFREFSNSVLGHIMSTLASSESVLQ